MIGVRLKEIRKEKKMTLKDLAEGAGVSISFLSQVERGKSSVTLESLRKISEVLGVNPSTFFPSNNEPVSEPWVNPPIQFVSEVLDIGMTVVQDPTAEDPIESQHLRCSGLCVAFSAKLC